MSGGFAVDVAILVEEGVEEGFDPGVLLYGQLLHLSSDLCYHSERPLIRFAATFSSLNAGIALV